MVEVVEGEADEEHEQGAYKTGEDHEGVAKGLDAVRPDHREQCSGAAGRVQAAGALHDGDGEPHGQARRQRRLVGRKQLWDITEQRQTREDGMHEDAGKESVPRKQLLDITNQPQTREDGMNEGAGKESVPSTKMADNSWAEARTQQHWQQGAVGRRWT